MKSFGWMQSDVNHSVGTWPTDTTKRRPHTWAGVFLFVSVVFYLGTLQSVLTVVGVRHLVDVLPSGIAPTQTKRQSSSQ